MVELSGLGVTARAATAWAVLLLSACTLAPQRAEQDRLARTQVLALVQGLNADLLSHDSATLTLERWCATHHLAEPARVVAQRVRGDAKPLPPALRERLAIDAAEPVAYRRVRLACGSHVLSEADNWYVPSRLTTDMNYRLDTTDEPFGKVVHALGFQRRTIAADLLWSPLPAGWEMSPQTDAERAPLRIPHALLRHEAVLFTAAQQPFSAVVETYTNHLLDFGPWADRLDADP
jgi:chorismate-pyruvate lyase